MTKKIPCGPFPTWTATTTTNWRRWRSQWCWRRNDGISVTTCSTHTTNSSQLLGNISHHNSKKSLLGRISNRKLINDSPDNNTTLVPSFLFLALPTMTTTTTTEIMTMSLLAKKWNCLFQFFGNKKTNVDEDRANPKATEGEGLLDGIKNQFSEDKVQGQAITDRDGQWCVT